jgi:hypothetical protein
VDAYSRNDVSRRLPAPADDCTGLPHVLPQLGESMPYHLSIGGDAASDRVVASSRSSRENQVGLNKAKRKKAPAKRGR